MTCEDETNSENNVISKEVPTEDQEEYEFVVVPPDGGFGWVVTAAGFMIILISDGILFSFGLILSELERVFREPVAKVAWIFSIVNGISLISGPIVSALSNRFGFRAVVIAGSFLGFVGLSTSSLAQSVNVLFLTLGLFFSLSIGLVFAPIVVGVGFYFDKKRALATGIVICGSGAGTFVFAPLTHWLLETYAFRGTFLILSAVYLNCAALGLFLIPLKPQRRKRTREIRNLQLIVLTDETTQSRKSALLLTGVEGQHGKVSQNEANKMEHGPLTNDTFSSKFKNSEEGEKLTKRKYFSDIFKFSLFRSPSFIVICISSFVQSVGWFVPFVYLAAHAVHLGIPKESASFLLALFGISGMFGRLFNGLLADHPKVSVLLLNNVGLSLSGLLMILCPFFTSYEELVFLSILLGLALSSTAVTRPILLGELFGRENVNNSFGFTLMFYGVASLFGTPMAGFLYDYLGDYRGAFYLAGSCVLFSASLCSSLGWINRWEKRRNSKK